MNQERKAEWVAALRSGEYEQGTGRLATIAYDDESMRYCCLGVACDLAVKAEIISESHSSQRIEYGKRREAILLPTEVQEWLGVNDDSPEVIYRGRIATLADLNDEGISFETIADIIEEQL